ncbi:MAG: flavodoxin family protein [Clostridia bacterium]|nr:flavodoxin family protein [Clostridia bacterium]
MKTVIINECDQVDVQNVFTFDLKRVSVKQCVGCWSCWWTTPGRCVYKDLDELYHEYITADKVVYFSKVTRGFVSGNLKSLWDQMIPLYLPYVSYKTGESMHAPRYETYPEIEFYYDGKFATEEGKQIFLDYINRVFYQFHTKLTVLKPIEEYVLEGSKKE